MSEQTSTRRTYLKIATAAATVSIAGCLGDDRTTVSLGTATQGSGSYANGQALQRAVDEHSDAVQIQAMETGGGGAPNFYLYDEGDIEAGGSNSFDAVNALNDTGQFSDDPVEDMPLQGYSYMILSMYWLARPEAGIQTTDDLSGSNVWVQPAGVGMRPPIDAVLESTGLEDEIEMFEMDRDDVAGALEEETLDAILAYSVNYDSIPGYEVEIDSRIDLEGVEATDDFVQAVQDTDGVPSETVSLDTREQEMEMDEIFSWSQDYQWGFGSELSEETVYEICEISYEENEFAREADERFPEFTEPSDMKFTYVPEWDFHPGVKAYWEELGIWDDETMSVGNI